MFCLNKKQGLGLQAQKKWDDKIIRNGLIKNKNKTFQCLFNDLDDKKNSPSGCKNSPRSLTVENISYLFKIKKNSIFLLTSNISFLFSLLDLMNKLLVFLLSYFFCVNLKPRMFGSLLSYFSCVNLKPRMFGSLLSYFSCVNLKPRKFGFLLFYFFSASTSNLEFLVPYYPIFFCVNLKPKMFGFLLSYFFYVLPGSLDS